MKIIYPLHDARTLWAQIERAVRASSTATTLSIRKQWKRSWARKVAWPWLKREIEIVSKVTGVVVMSLWLKRLVEPFPGLADPERVDPPGRDERCRPRRRAGSRSREGPP